MRYVGLWRPAASNQGPPTEAHMVEMGALVEQMMSKGYLLTTEPLGPPETGAAITRSGDSYTVGALTDRAGGYALLQAGSLEECIEQVKRFLAAAGDGVCEIRQIVDMGPRP